MVDTVSKKRKRGSITEEDICTLLPKYSATQVLALLREVAQWPDVKIDWNALVKKSSIGIDNPRECQLLWRHLAYRHSLVDKIEPAAQPLDDDSDLEYELEASPPVSNDVLEEAAHCVKVLALGSPNESLMPNNSSVEVDVHNGQISNISSEHHSVLHSSNLSLPVSVQKQTQCAGISGEGLDANGATNSNFPSRRKRKPWSEEEDLILINAVRKHGEGIWATIVKSEFNGNRTASQLSQRWAILKKKQGSLNVGVSGTQLSEQHLATRHALEQALKNTLTTVGNGVAGTSHTTDLNVLNKDSPATNVVMPSQQQLTQATSVKSGPMNSTLTPRPLPRKAPIKPSVTTDSLQATAVAVGARIASPSDAESLLKAAQAKGKVHIRNGSSVIKSQTAGNTGSLPPNVHFIRTGLNNTPTATPSGTPSFAAGGQQAKGGAVKLSVATSSVSQTRTAPIVVLERNNSTVSSLANELQQMENKISDEIKVLCSDTKPVMDVLEDTKTSSGKDQSGSPNADMNPGKQKADSGNSHSERSKDLTENKVCKQVSEKPTPKEKNEKASSLQEGGNSGVSEKHEVLTSVVVNGGVEKVKASSEEVAGAAKHTL